MPDIRDIPDTKPVRTTAFGLLSHKPRWSLSLRGWLVALAVCSVVAVTMFLNLHSFLALTKPVQSDTLIVEGWITEQALDNIVAEFHRGAYQHIYTTGGKITWSSADRYGRTYAGYCAFCLHAAGIPTNSIVSIACVDKDWDRTLTSAVAVRDYFRTHGGMPASANVITSGPHARRTRLLYRRAFRDDTSIGVVSIPRSDYDPAAWWRSSSGVREVCGEALAYLYFRFISSSES